MSKSIELSDDQFNTLISQLTGDSLGYGRELGERNTFDYLIAVKTAKDDVDALITHLTSDEPPGIKSVDEAKSIVRKGKDE